MLENVQIGLDLASAISIIGAASLFLWQFYRERNRNRKSEIWTNFKEIADDIAEQKIEISDLIAKQLYYKEDGSKVTTDDLAKILQQLKQLTTKLQFHIRYDAKQDVRNILAYHSPGNYGDHPIINLLDKTIHNIYMYIDWLHKIEKKIKEIEKIEEKEEKDNKIKDQIDEIKDATINETTLREVIEAAAHDYADVYRREVNNFEQGVNEFLKKNRSDFIKNYELTDKELESFWVLYNMPLYGESEEEKSKALQELDFRLASLIMKHKFSLQIILDNFNHTLLEEIKRL